MTTPDWDTRLQQLIDITKPAPAAAKVDPNAITLTSAQLNALLGQNANPFCGPCAVWRFSRGDWPFAGKPGLWGKAEKLSKFSGVAS
jgi:hypothetical protein